MSQSLILIGLPDSGKTNYIARFWKALHSGNGQLEIINAPEIKYVEDALAHLLQGKFAPRSEKNIEESRRDFIATVRHRLTKQEVDLAVPDITGELWKNAVASTELPTEWMDQLKSSRGALLFVRVLSDQNVDPPDWVTSRELMSMEWAQAAESEMPTQIVLCELLRFLELMLCRGPDGKRRVAVMVTAWDLLDEEARAAGPRAFMQAQYPLFAERVNDTEDLSIEFFGVSVVGGDLERDDEFRNRYFHEDLTKAGYVVSERNGSIIEEHDLTAPVGWLVGEQ